MGQENERESNERKAFTVFNNRGFQLRLHNGIIVSVMFDAFSYSGNRGIGQVYRFHGKEAMGCDNAEIAFFDEDGGEWRTKEVGKMIGLDLEDDVDVIGWTTMETFLKLLDVARKL